MYGKATQKRLEESPVNPNTVVTIVNKKNSNSNYGNYQVRMMQDKNGKPIGFAYCPQEFNAPPVLPSSCNPIAALIAVF
jgi:hypothetical protein